MNHVEQEVRRMDFFDEHPALYACEWCGELFEATPYPQSCPQCGRIYGDFVYDRDTGEKHGGEILIRPATEHESRRFYELRRQGETRRIRTDAVRKPD